jgi:hypothetical protein
MASILNADRIVGQARLCFCHWSGCFMLDTVRGDIVFNGLQEQIQGLVVDLGATGLS